jgi:hypothetical protein
MKIRKQIVLIMNSHNILSEYLTKRQTMSSILKSKA